jgi:ATP-dependent RNA helicase RhlE
MLFDDLRLIQPLLRAVRAAGYRTPTPIQAQAIPLVLDGRDVLGSAQTGTGKTAAFALPILQRFYMDSAPRGRRPGRIRALVLCPTRELAQQIFDSFRDYGRHTSLRQVVIFGGVNQHAQVCALQSGTDILIATPGRLLDLMGQGVVSLAGVEVLVLDEADRMLDMGFLPDIRRILADVPRQRQTLFFSATMPEPIRKLSQDMLKNPATVQVARVSSPAVTVAHWVYHVEKPDKPAMLTRFLTSTPHTRVLVFTRTKHGADKLSKHLVRDGLHAAALHGNKSQATRTRALADFRSAHTPVLVATDIAARGLDVDDISHVVNYDLTREPETYVHRIGRTGRAGAAGTAVSFCSTEERTSLRDIERLLREPLQPAAELPQHAQARELLHPAAERPTHAKPHQRPRPAKPREQLSPTAERPKHAKLHQQPRPAAERPKHAKTREQPKHAKHHEQPKPHQQPRPAADQPKHAQPPTPKPHPNPTPNETAPKPAQLHGGSRRGLSPSRSRRRRLRHAMRS